MPAARNSSARRANSVSSFTHGAHQLAQSVTTIGAATPSFASAVSPSGVSIGNGGSGTRAASGMRAVSLDAKVVKVTLLEDRAMVQRTGTVMLEPGQHKLVVKDVAPVLQDLSLRAQAKGAKVVDARVRRAILVTSEEKPEQAKALEKDVDVLTEKVKQLSEDRALTHQRRIRLEEILERGFSELPEDVSWGLSAPQWKESLEGLYEKVRALRERALSLDQQLRDVTRDRSMLVVQRQMFDRPDTRFTSWLEADVVVTAKTAVEVTFEYTVPNALWRPMHSARLAPCAITFPSIES